MERVAEEEDKVVDDQKVTALPSKGSHRKSRLTATGSMAVQDKKRKKKKIGEMGMESGTKVSGIHLRSTTMVAVTEKPKVVEDRQQSRLRQLVLNRRLRLNLVGVPGRTMVVCVRIFTVSARKIMMMMISTWTHSSSQVGQGNLYGC